MEEDIYIKALKFAEQHKKFTLQELQQGLSLDDEQLDLFAIQTHHKQIFYQNTTNFYNNYKTTNSPVYFSVEDKFRLLEHEELKHARESSLSATRLAFAALFVSIISSSASIYFNVEPSNQLSDLIKTVSIVSQKLDTSNRSLKTIEASVNKQQSTKHDWGKDIAEINSQIQKDLEVIKNEIRP